eukprot:315293-Hanusia_phi.AAC.1
MNPSVRESFFVDVSFLQSDYTSLVRISYTSAESTSWLSETTLVCLPPSGTNGQKSIILTAGLVVSTRSKLISYDHYKVLKISSGECYDVTSTNTSSDSIQIQYTNATLTVSGINFGQQDSTSTFQVGQSSCASVFWTSDTSIICTTAEITSWWCNDCAAGKYTEYSDVQSAAFSCVDCPDLSTSTLRSNYCCLYCTNGTCDQLSLLEAYSFADASCAPVTPASQIRGGVPFASSSSSVACSFSGKDIGVLFEGALCYSNINDGTYGNGSQWKANSNVTAAFVGVVFNSTQRVKYISIVTSNSSSYGCEIGSEWQIQFLPLNYSNAEGEYATDYWFNVGNFSLMSWGRNTFEINGVILANAIRLFSTSPANSCFDELETFSDLDTVPNINTTCQQILEITYGSSGTCEARTCNLPCHDGHTILDHEYPHKDYGYSCRMLRRLPMPEAHQPNLNQPGSRKTLSS